MIDFAKLAAPFPPSAVSWRIGSTTADKTRGMALAYLDARDVADRLDGICGPDKWACKYSHVGAITVCEIGLRIIAEDGFEWVWKADGAGQSDIEAEKGALSDAFKRAAVRWGIGRYLYHLPSPWVEIVQKGRSAVIADHEYKRLEDILAKASAGLPQAKEPPPAPNTDVVEGLARWCRDQTLFLTNATTAEDIDRWLKVNAANIKKLGKENEVLFNKLKLAKDEALDRIRAPV